jgi:hypothetical protein
MPGRYIKPGHWVEEEEPLPQLPNNLTLEGKMKEAAVAEAEVEAAVAEAEKAAEKADKMHAISGERYPETEKVLHDARRKLKRANDALQNIIEQSGGRRYKSKRHKRTSKRHKRTSKRHKRTSKRHKK